MTNEPISQAEIDALLRGTRPAQGGREWAALEAAAASALESAWAVAPALLGVAARLGPVQAATATAAEAAARMGVDLIWGRTQVGGAPAYVLLPRPLALLVVGLLLGGAAPPDLSATGAAALSEALAQLAGRALARMAAQAGWGGTPAAVEVIPAEAAAAAGLPTGGDPLLLLQFSVDLGAAAGPMALALPLPEAGRLAAALEASGRAAGGPPPAVAAGFPGGRPAGIPAARADAPPGMGAPAAEGAVRPPVVAYQAAQFRELAGGEPQAPAPRNIDLLLDVTLQVTVELGRTSKQIKDVLALGPGSVIELEKLAGEPVDVLVNGKLIARGEVVVIDEHFGVRITDIVSPQDRAASLGR